MPCGVCCIGAAGKRAAADAKARETAPDIFVKNTEKSKQKPHKDA